MHFDILIEDKSGEIMLKHLMPKIITKPNTTYKIWHYQGIGSLPRHMKSAKNIKGKLQVEFEHS